MGKGIAYGVGVGPGDPELMTVKAIRLIRENDVIALPGQEPKETTAYQIAVQINLKEILPRGVSHQNCEGHCRGAVRT